MINKFCRSKAIRHICAMFLISILAFVTIGAASQTPSQSARQISTKNKNTPISAIAISNYLAAQQNADLNDEEKIKTAIDAYFTLRYEGQKSIMEQNFSSLIEDSTLDWVKKEKDKREIELYIASLFDLGYQSYKFILDYDSIEIENDKAVVLLKQSHQVVYKAVAPQISELSGLPHIITLHSKNGVWSIYKDEYEDEYTRLIETTPKEKIKQQVDENYKFSRENDSAILEEAPANPKVNPLYYGSFAYNSAAAVIFADNYASSNSSPAPIPQAIKMRTRRLMDRHIQAVGCRTIKWNRIRIVQTLCLKRFLKAQAIKVGIQITLIQLLMITIGTISFHQQHKGLLPG